MINDTSSYHADAMPYGGVKASGYGVEGPRYAVQDMTDPRIVVLNLAPMKLAGLDLRLPASRDARRGDRRPRRPRHRRDRADADAAAPAPDRPATPTGGARCASHLERHGVACISVNPGFVDLNLISVNPEFRELSLRQLEAGLELAHDLHAGRHVVVPGRRHALAPAPSDDARGVLLDGLERLLRTRRAARRRDRAGELALRLPGRRRTSCSRSPRRSTTRGCASATTSPTGSRQEDPAEGVRRVAPRLGLVHVSDTWRRPLGAHERRARRRRLRRVRRRRRRRGLRRTDRLRARRRRGPGAAAGRRPARAGRLRCGAPA